MEFTTAMSYCFLLFCSIIIIVQSQGATFQYDFCLNGGSLIKFEDGNPLGEMACFCASGFYGHRCEYKDVRLLNHHNHYDHPAASIKPGKNADNKNVHLTGMKIGKVVDIKRHRWLKHWKQYLINDSECICSCRK